MIARYIDLYTERLQQSLKQSQNII